MGNNISSLCQEKFICKRSLFILRVSFETKPNDQSARQHLKPRFKNLDKLRKKSKHTNRKIKSIRDKSRFFYVK